MKTLIYRIKAISNLHVGSGEANFGVVDNLIQRDAATGIPAIHASSLKGALREHCEANGMAPYILRYIFGSDAKDNKSHEVGHFRFFDANLLTLPVRSDKSPYISATCPLLVKDYLSKRKIIAGSDSINLTILNKATQGIPKVTNQSHNNALIEDFEQQAVWIGAENDKEKEELKQLKQEVLLSTSFALLHDEDFGRLCNNDHLPVIARNNLAAGHENLWYEQVLPRFSTLCFFVLVPDDAPEEAKLPIENTLVQIGANATVGYGYCQIQLVNQSTDKTSGKE